MSSRSRFRTERAKARAQRRRNQRIGLILIVVLALAAIVWGLLLPNTGQEESPLNLSNAEVITTASGLMYQDDVIGSGAEALAGDSVAVHYTGYFADGSIFDSSVERGVPFTFVLGTRGVIAGWDEGVAGMRVGGVRILTVPPALAYGPGGAPPTIPPNTTLIFRVELLNVE